MFVQGHTVFGDDLDLRFHAYWEGDKSPSFVEPRRLACNTSLVDYLGTLEYRDRASLVSWLDAYRVEPPSQHAGLTWDFSKTRRGDPLAERLCIFACSWAAFPP